MAGQVTLPGSRLANELPSHLQLVQAEQRGDGVGEDHDRSRRGGERPGHHALQGRRPDCPAGKERRPLPPETMAAILFF